MVVELEDGSRTGGEGETALDTSLKDLLKGIEREREAPGLRDLFSRSACSLGKTSALAGASGSLTIEEASVEFGFACIVSGGPDCHSRCILHSNAGCGSSQSLIAQTCKPFMHLLPALIFDAGQEPLLKRMHFGFPALIRMLQPSGMFTVDFPSPLPAL